MIDDFRDVLQSAPGTSQLAQLGALPAADVLSEVQRLHSRQPTGHSTACSLFATAGDTSAMQTLVTAFDGLDAARSFLAFARADTAAALRGFLVLPMAMCSSAPCR